MGFWGVKVNLVWIHMVGMDNFLLFNKHKFNFKWLIILYFYFNDGYFNIKDFYFNDRHFNNFVNFFLVMLVIN